MFQSREAGQTGHPGTAGVHQKTRAAECSGGGPVMTSSWDVKDQDLIFQLVMMESRTTLSMNWTWRSVRSWLTAAIPRRQYQLVQEEQVEHLLMVQHLLMELLLQMVKHPLMELLLVNPSPPK